MFSGSYVALVTPFLDGKIDFKRLDELIDLHLEQGTDGIVPCGTTGESATMSHEEHEVVIRAVVERVQGRIPVLAGTGSNNTAEAIRLTRFAQDVGASGALLITPYYNKPTQTGLTRHFEAIASETTLPLVLYNVPSRTGVNLLPPAVIECAKIPNVVGIKEASGSIDQTVEIVRETDLSVLSGDDSLTLPLMSVGARGVISVAANVAPRMVADMTRLASSGDFAAARELHLKLFPLFGGLFVETNPIPVKAALAMQGRIGAEVRLPMTEMSEELMPGLKKILTELGLL